MWKTCHPDCQYNLINICADQVYLYVLTSNRQLLKCKFKSPDKTFIMIECFHHIESIINIRILGVFHIHFNLVLTKDGVYYVNDKQELVRTKYNTIYDYCAQELQMTYKTIDLKLQNEIQTKELNIKGINIILKIL